LGFFKKSLEENTNYYTLSNTNSRSVAFFANAPSGFNNRYVLNGTVRYEGSNAMGESRTARWTPTWNVAGSWNVDQEKFFEALQQADPKGVVLDYLNSVEKYPVVLKKLMTDMDALAYVFRDKDPYELRHNLHQFTKELLSGNAEQPKPKEAAPVVETKPTPEPKPAIPVIGKQVTAQAAPSEPVHDRNYWNDYLRKHPMG
jgi:hypothetical protein